MSAAKDPGETPKRKRKMNTTTRTETLPQRRAPLYASPWMALFMVLRNEFLASGDRK